MANNIILQNCTFEKIINLSKMIITNVWCSESKFIYSCIKDMSSCKLRTDVLSYIGDVDNKQVEQNDVMMTISQVLLQDAKSVEASNILKQIPIHKNLKESNSLN
jgi:hypothetical protein